MASDSDDEMEVEKKGRPASNASYGLKLGVHTKIMDGSAFAATLGASSSSFSSSFSSAKSTARKPLGGRIRIGMEQDSDDSDDEFLRGKARREQVDAAKSKLTVGDMMKAEPPPPDMSMLVNSKVGSGVPGSARSARMDDDDTWLDDATDVDIYASKPASKRSLVEAEESTSSSSSSSMRRNASAYPLTYLDKSSANSSSSSSSGAFHRDLPSHISEDCKQRAYEPLLLPSQHGRPQRQVPAQAAQYLYPHQVEGALWLWDKLCLRQGGILGDDMGMGKTIQAIALFLAHFEKTCTYDDEKRNRERRNKALAGEPLGAAFHKPCLIVCPKSVVTNWCNELRRWGHFAIDTNAEITQTQVNYLQNGINEIYVTAYTSLKKNSDNLKLVDWGVIVYDEAHNYLKNTKTETYQMAMKLKKADVRFLFTGTPVQNRLEEFYSLMVVLTNEHFLSKEIYKEHYIEPIKKGESTKATEREKVRAREVRQEHRINVLEKYYLARMKTSLEGKNKLRDKEEIIVLCDLSPLQKDLYRHLLSLPDFDNCRRYEEECPCGGCPGEKRKLCCNDMYCLPYIRPAPGQPFLAEIDSRAVQWKQLHTSGLACDKCPTCISLGCLDRLRKVVMHPCLLQVPRIKAGEKRSAEEAKRAEFTQQALSPELLKRLGGFELDPNYRNRAKQLESSGKMVQLDNMLQNFTARGEKTLVFSQSNKMLNIILDLVKVRGWDFLRLDGQTPNRQALVDDFQSPSSTRKVFLINTITLTLTSNLWMLTL